MSNTVILSGTEDTDRERRVREKLRDERTLAAFEHLLDRIDALETTVNRLVMVMEQAPVHMAMLADIADEAYRKADQQGIRLEERLQTALAIANQLTAPEMAARVDSALKLVDQLPGIAAMTVDTLDNAMQDAIAEGLDPQAIGHTLVTASHALSETAASKAPARSGLLSMLWSMRDPDILKALGFSLSFLKNWGKRL